MIDWHSLFEEARPNPGATPSLLSKFTTEVSLPLTAAEVQSIHAGQINPFFPSDSQCRTWQPIDVSKWWVPDRPLPASYLSLLSWSNGGEFRRGERWMQLFPALDPIHGVRAIMLGYHVPEYMPGALPFAFDGCGTFYLLDMRKPAVGDEYPVLLAHSTYLSWEPDAIEMLASNLVDAIQT